MPSKDFTEFREVKLVPGIKPMTDYTDAESHSFHGCRNVVLITCGSFNPPTIMHMRMFECARDYLQQEIGVQVLEGIMSPTADSYGKPDLAKAKDRLRMCELATKGSTWLRADGWECEHHLPLLRGKYSSNASGDGSDVALVLLCGGDVVESFKAVKPNGDPVWSSEDVKCILEDFGLIVFKRIRADPVETINALDLGHLIGNTVHLTNDIVFPNDVCSTNLRKAIRAGISIKYCTPEAVEEYISENSLYL